MIERLRPYQRIHLEHARRALGAGRSCLISAFTAFGKTFTGLAIIEPQASRTLWLADTSDLTWQNAEEAIEVGIPLAKPTHVGLTRRLKKRAAKAGGEYVPSKQMRRHDPTKANYHGGLECRTYAWIATQLRKSGPGALRGRWDVIVCDEADLAMAPKFAAAIRATGARLLGLTATPFRTDGAQLGAMFGELVKLTPAELAAIGLPGESFSRCMTVVDGIELEWLVDCAAHRVVFEEAGDNQYSPYLDTDSHRRQVWEQWAGLAADRKTIVVLDTIEAAESFAATGRAMGFSAASVHMRSDDTLDDFKQGRFDVACTVAMAYRGINYPPVSALVFCVDTKSLARQFQFLGRGLRLSPETGKTDCLMLIASKSSYRELDLTLFDSIQGPMTEPESMTEKGGGLSEETPDDELPTISNVISRLERVRLWRQRVQRVKTMPWVDVDGAGVLCLEPSNGDWNKGRWLVVELAAWSSSRCIVRELWTDRRYLSRLAVVATNVDEPTAFALAEQYVARPGSSGFFHVDVTDARKLVRRWRKNAGPPSESLTRDLAERGLPVPRTHGEGVLALRTWHARQNEWQRRGASGQ